MGFIITLIIAGILLLLAEILLVPGVGIAGVLGLAALVGSCVYAFCMIGLTAGTAVTAFNTFLVVGLTVYVLRAKTWKKFSLQTNIDSKVQPDSDELVEIGDKGRTVTRLAPSGSARFGKEVYEVKALEGMIDPGVDVEVVLIEKNRIIVRPAGEDF